jgi:hypothetical protein
VAWTYKVKEALRYVFQTPCFDDAEYALDSLLGPGQRRWEGANQVPVLWSYSPWDGSASGPIHSLFSSRRPASRS